MTVGRTPQVVTETLYALAVAPREERFVPTELRLITTEEGRRQALLDLLDSGHARLSELCRAHGLDRDSIQFDERSVEVVTDPQGRPLEDIRTVTDNQCGADAIVRLVRRLTADADCALHVSLAGGRKTLGFYLGYALSLFGRPQDRLSHVLVEPEFESLPDFFFPTPDTRILRRRDGRGTVDARDARIELADIPVVSLRGLLDPSLIGDDSAGYAQIVSRARRQLDASPSLTVNWKTLAIRVGSIDIPMKLPERVWYLFFVHRAVQGLPGFGWRLTPSTDTARELRRFVRGLDLIRHGADEDLCDPWITRGGQLDFQAADRRKTNVNNCLKAVLGPGPAGDYLIVKEGRRGNARYRIPLDASSIHIEETGP